MKFEILFAGLNKAKSALDRISNINKETKEVTKNMEKATKAVNHVDKAMRKTDNTTKQLAKSHKILQNQVGGVGDKLKDATGTTPIFNMIDGIKKMSSAFGGGIKGMIKGVWAFGTSLAAAIWPIAAIAAAFYVLKKAWEANIGGLQTKFFKVFGSMKTLWAKFEVGLIKGLKALSPLFEGIFAIITPIFGALGQIGKAFSKVFGGNQGKTFLIILSAIGKVAGFVGKVLGGIITIALVPIVKYFEMVFAIIGKIRGAFTGLGSVFAGIGDMIVSSLQSIWDFILKIINKIPNAFLPKSIEQLKTSGSTPSPAAEAKSTNNSNITNNNQQVSVSTSRDIRSDTAAPFAEMLALQMQSNY